MLENAGHHAQRDEREITVGLVHHVIALDVDDGQMQMESAAALVTPRLAEECAEHSALREHILHGRLQQERAVGGIQRLAVPQIDLVLRGAELVVAGERTDVELVDHAQQMQEVALGVNAGSGLVDASGLVQDALPGAVDLVRHVELELGSDDRDQAEQLVLRNDAAQQGARGDHVR